MQRQQMIIFKFYCKDRGTGDVAGIFILATSVVILLGVNKGIENISKVLMPLLVVLSVIIAVFVVTRPGAGAGIVYY